MNTTKENEPKHESIGERHGLALPIELEEGAPPFLARSAMAVLSGLIIVMLVWVNIAKVRELSVALGEIAPYGSTREAAHLEGGIVDEVLVAPGDVVKEGQALVRLRTENAGGEYDRFAARRANLYLRSERLAAQTEDREPDFSKFADEWPALISEQMAIYSTSVDQHRAAMATLIAREASTESEVTKAKAELNAETELLRISKEQLAIQDELIDEGYTSKQVHLEARAAVFSAEAKAAAAKTRLEQARRARNSAVADRIGGEAEYRNGLAQERADIVAELRELEEPIIALKDRAYRLTVRAPIAGVVNDVLVNGQGDVVRPGGVIAEITPKETTLIAEVRVNPNDIGHIAIGQITDITVTTFDPNLYGKVSGRVSHVSADTFTDERTGEAYYIAFVELSQQEIGKGRRLRQLSPGMEVRAEIITQSRSLMQYALKPVTRSLDQAFTER